MKILCTYCTPDGVVPDHAHSPLSSSDTWSNFVCALRTTLSATVYIVEKYWLLFTSSGTTSSVDGLVPAVCGLWESTQQTVSIKKGERDSLPSACICTFSSIEPVSWVRLRPSQRGSTTATTATTSSHLSPRAGFVCLSPLSSRVSCKLDLLFALGHTHFPPGRSRHFLLCH